MMRYEDKPWLQHWDADQLALAAPPPTPLHAFRASAAAAPERVAIAYFDGKLTYRQVGELTDGLARHLAGRGFQRGDRIAVVLQNTPQFVLAVLGAWKAGGIVVPVNPMYKEREITHVLTDAEVTAIVCHERAWESYLRKTTEGSPVRIALTASELDLQTRNDERVLRDLGRVRATDADDLLTVARAAAGPPPAGRDLTADDIALISYTSGTSGVPKGATNTHGNIVYNAYRQARLLALPDDSAIFALAPLFHITGMVCQLMAALTGGNSIVLAYRFEPGVVLDAIREHRPAYMVGPSTAYMALMARPDATAEDFASFRMLSSGGAPLPPAVVERFRERFGHYIRNGYGLTECTAPCASVPPGLEAPVDPVSGTLAVGIPGPDTVVRIVDDAGRDVPFGEPGEIAVRGPMVVPGYWRRPEESTATMPDGELRTGDIGFMDTAGWLYVIDRKKDMINASGFKVWPREVEDVLYTHPAVREAAVVGVPDPYRGETVRAYVSLRPGTEASPDEIIAYCKDRLAAYKYPRSVEVVPELPKTTTGKILRRELRAAAAGGDAVN
ncbi:MULTISPECIES: long-chain-fatty-acid--CoA ligase [Streptomycetaceae]|uniref:Acyl-CoA synthetase, long chain-fatty acid:CoA ligase n=1 Tax=Streptantibioticus cattleyicolor (strain ATCC 35852 / DSM 46488 / JCM 4925 / NBRC 14057 / NRRL 8057) TaxID=1003195 RepID=F8JX00_STREN|nr:MULTISPECIES: long-chain fatty acid--CoA ligase [Streptomycetaceae]AEW93270.1 acyl-CoA synthetase, long chain-fatty acid:CoA ligase [Streptantibioticus cattleyicolor NRRL 8057 = DSM 46488]MYS57991.1 AMP-binding protein [Streptomyces sp. SID5468]CCB73630.1 putative acyl-CoA synthetase, long chain-fatty acid:CoA ligase [Streptantibioticus cattleyicolor NRRL 8057 = DSM 46488]